MAQQVGSNALRDGLFLSFYPVESLPWFMGGAALLALPAAILAGRALRNRGPARVAPALFAANAALFLVEWLLLGALPRVATALLYLHSSVLGAIAISAFWSLLNERFDPHSAKPLMAKVAAAATLGGLAGGVLAERGAALLPQGALFLVLFAVLAACVAGALAVAGSAPPRKARPGTSEEDGSGWQHVRRVPLLRDLALVVALAAGLAALVDYGLKAQAVAHFGRGEALVRFFGLFYSGTALAAVLVQSTLGSRALARLGLGGSVATHPAAVGVAAVAGFALPPLVAGVLPRGLDVTLRSSLFRSGYELLYTPLSEGVKRAAKSLVDVACDCAGKGAGAGLILAVAAVSPGRAAQWVAAAAVAVAGAELLVARRLRAGYVGALEGGLRRQADDLEEPSPQYSLADFTVVGSLGGIDRAAVEKALAAAAPAGSAADAALRPADPVVAALAELRSGSAVRALAALRELPRDPVLIGALVPLLGRGNLVKPVVAALSGFGARAAGEMVSALLDPRTDEAVRRRLPVALKSCASPIARDGLVAALGDDDLELRARSARALLALFDAHPGLAAPVPSALAAVERELSSEGDEGQRRDHVFNLLALALDREPVRIAARSFSTDDAHVRGTALEYLETVLSPRLYGALQPLLAAGGAPRSRRRDAADARAELMKAGATMTVSREELRRQLEAAARDES